MTRSCVSWHCASRPDRPVRSHIPAPQPPQHRTLRERAVENRRRELRSRWAGRGSPGFLERRARGDQAHDRARRRGGRGDPVRRRARASPRLASPRRRAAPRDPVAVARSRAGRSGLLAAPTGRIGCSWAGRAPIVHPSFSTNLQRPLAAEQIRGLSTCFASPRAGCKARTRPYGPSTCFASFCAGREARTRPG
jgi:hypothetical protein